MTLYYGIAVIAVFFYAILAVIAKKLMADMPPFAFIAVSMAFLSIMAAGVSYFSEKSFSYLHITADNLLWLSLFAIFNLIGFGLLLTAISKIPVVEYQIIAILTPVFTGVIAYYALSEALSPKYFVGLIFIGIGLYIALKK